MVKAFNDPRIILVSGIGKGISEALNLGYNLARAEIIVRCDADDYICPNTRLYKQVSFLNDNPTYSAVCGNFAGMDQYDNDLGSFNCGDTSMDITELIKSGVIKSHWGSYAIRKQLFNILKGFRPYFITAEDVDFQLRIAEQSQVMYFPEHWYVYRLHSDSITHTQREKTKLAYEATAKRFQQQRLSTGKDDLELGVANAIVEQQDASEPTSAKMHAFQLAIGNSWVLHAQNKKTQALRLLFKLFQKNPSSFMLMKQLILLAIK